jgi:ubiquinone/menaquinone biosynthesis C-methylase UbiE
MNKENNKRVCPVERAGGLDNSLRRFLQNPQKILKPYIHKGMKVIDLGCGPGFFSTEIAKLLVDSGKVIAADLQEGMLEKLKKKIIRTELERTIEIHQCTENETGVREKVDFVLAFYMIHEVPDPDRLFRELKSLLNPDGKILIVEPKFHVSEKSFEKMVDGIKCLGFDIIERPKVFFSRSILVKNN